MAQRAAEWSEHDLSHRFAMGPPTDELAALGGTLDQLLDRVASAIRAEQRLTAELAHELRTPLTNIQGSAGLALMRGVEDAEDREDFEEPKRYEPGLVLAVDGSFHRLDSELRGWGQRDFPHYHHTASKEPVEPSHEQRLLDELAALLAKHGAG